MAAYLNNKSVFFSEMSGSAAGFFPWCENTFALALEKDLPLFIIVGSMSSHWCRVMHRESFCNAETAAIIRGRFIPVAVDIDEHPEVFAMFRDAAELMGTPAGIPLTVFATPGCVPFFVGSYIPRDSLGGKPGLKSLLAAISEKWEHECGDLIRAAGEISRRMLSKQPAGKPADPKELIAAAEKQLSDSFDSEYGGFGSGRKFASAHSLLFLTRLAKLQDKTLPREGVEKAVMQMYRGGFFDHIGGGFFRYANDREWLKPCYEKNLAENAMLVLLCAELWQGGRLQLYRDIAERTLDFCIRELKDENGGYRCCMDSDSDGMEGAYYLFTQAEVQSVLGKDEGKHFCECYDITEEGNLRGRSIPNLLLNGRWRLLPEGYEDYREKLRIFRDERVEIGSSNVMTLASNALILSALARCAALFDDPVYKNEARELEAFIANTLEANGVPAHSITENSLVSDALLEDIAFYVLAELSLYSTDYSPVHLEKAKSLADIILRDYACESGGFCDCIGGEGIFSRPQTVYDISLPSGNSACAVLFEELAALGCGEKYDIAAQRQLGFIASHCGSYPAGSGFALCSMLGRVTGEKCLVFVSANGEMHPAYGIITSRYSPDMHYAVKNSDNAEDLAAVLPFTASCTEDGIYMKSGSLLTKIN